MSVTPEKPDEARFPLVLFDDDQWLIVCYSMDDVYSAVEPDFVDEIVAAFDALAHPVRVRECQGKVTIDVGGPPDPDELQVHVQRFFSLWTFDAPPEFAGDVAQYVTAVTLQSRSARERKRKARG